MQKAVFLDRDGVLNVDEGYTYQRNHLKLYPEVGNCLANLKRLGYLLLVITNQSGVARGYFTLEEVARFHEAMQAKLKEAADVQIDKFYVSPYHPEGKITEFSKPSECRKPGTANVEKAIEEFHIDRTMSYFIGDKPSDMECAKRARLTGIYLDRFHQGHRLHAGITVNNLHQAVTFIEADAKRSR